MNKVLSASRNSVCREPGILHRRGCVSTVVLFASMILLGVGWVVKGDADAAIRPDSDDFILSGRAILSWIATGGAGLEAMKAHAVFPHYFIPSIILAGVDMYFSDPVTKIVALNCVLFSVVVVLMYQFWVSIHGAWTHWAGKQGFFVAGVGGFYIVFGLPDPFLYSYTVLTDIIFLFWVAAFVAATSRGILEGGRASWMFAVLLAVAAPYVRPTGVVLPVLFLYAVVIHVLVRCNVDLRTIAVISIGLPLMVMLLLVPWLVSAKINGSSSVNEIIPGLFQQEFKQAVYFFKTGIIVSDRPETYVDSPSSYMDVLKMIVYRLGYYLVPLRFGDMPYTVIHNVVNFVYILAAWPLMFIGIRRLVSAGNRCRIVALFLVMVALSYALLHSVTLLSFGWRYQLPAMVPLWMLAGVGLYSLLGRPMRERLKAA